MFLGAPRFGCCQDVMTFARCDCAFNTVGMVRRWCEGLHVSSYSLVGSTYGDIISFGPLRIGLFYGDYLGGRQSLFASPRTAPNISIS